MPCTSTCSVAFDVDPFMLAGTHTGNKCSVSNTCPGGANCCREKDTQTTCCITGGDTGNGVLLDTCSFPSQQPNSDPSDCIATRECTVAADCNDGNACTVDSCDATFKVCRHVPGNAGATCRAANGACDVAEVCTGSSPSVPPISTPRAAYAGTPMASVTSRNRATVRALTARPTGSRRPARSVAPGVVRSATSPKAATASARIARQMARRRTARPATTVTPARPPTAVRTARAAALPWSATTTTRARATAVTPQAGASTCRIARRAATAVPVRTAMLASVGRAPRGRRSIAMTATSARRTPATRRPAASTRTTMRPVTMGTPARPTTPVPAAPALEGLRRTATTAMRVRPTPAMPSWGVGTLAYRRAATSMASARIPMRARSTSDASGMCASATRAAATIRTAAPTMAVTRKPGAHTSTTARRATMGMPAPPTIPAPLVAASGPSSTVPTRIPARTIPATPARDV